MTTYYVTSEELLGDNYLNIDIGCSSYNPTIDSTVTVTVTVKDVYGDAVSGEEVTITASEGNFTAYNGSSITGASSHTGTTNSSGQFTLTYTCSEWGLITFSANNVTTQINVSGFREILSNSTFKLFVDESQRIAQVRGNRSGITITEGESFVSSDFIIPTEYRPKNTSMAQASRNMPIIHFVKNTTGQNGLFNQGTTQTNYTLNMINEWHY